MSVLVADSSAICEYVLQTEQGARVSSLLRGGEHDLHVPHLCDVELVSAIRRFLFQSDMDRHRALEALQDYVDLPITRHAHVELMPRALGLRFNFTASDAMYVALAELLEGTLLTADRSLARAAAAHTSLLVEEV